MKLQQVKTTDQTSYNGETILRLKNMNTDFTAGYKQVFGINATPVVMSGGLFSDITTWEGGLGKDLVDEGHNVWLIEMTGGPYTDCENCPNYKYQDLVDHYWPTLIAGVQEYSEQQKVHYVGHSNGCRAALSSLNEYSTGKNNAGYYWDFETGSWIFSDLAINPVDKFFGVACPIVLNDETTFTKAARAPLRTVLGLPVQESIITPVNELIANTNIGDYFFKIWDDTLHMTLNDFVYFANPILLFTGQYELGTSLVTLGSLFESMKYASWSGDGHDISRSLMEFYINLSQDDESGINLENLNVSSMHLYYGAPSDLIVPGGDFDYLKSNYGINSTAIVSPLPFGALYVQPKFNDHATLVVNSKVLDSITREVGLK